MAKNNNIIELNGKRFDARTGKLLGEASTLPIAPARPKLPRSHSGRVMDGVIMDGAPAIIPVKPAPSAHPVHRTSHAPKPLAAHQPQHSKTLRREFVKTPAVESKRPLRGQTPVDLVKAGPSALVVKPKLSSEQIDRTKAARASEVSRSNRVVRFQPGGQPARYEFAATPPARTVAATPQPKRPTATPQPKDLFEHALANASSHEQPAPKESHRQKVRRGVRKHARRFSIATATVAIIILGGFVAYQNKVALEMQLASGRAGFAASMPGYAPAGFAARNLSYSLGTVTIGFVARDDKSFKLVQKQSNWDSETLLQNFVADTDQPYRAYQAAGRTVYTYGAGGATWVNGGVWYQVSGNAHLSNNQIIDLAMSM